MNITDIYRTFHTMAAEYTFFSSSMEHSPEKITCYVKSLNKFKKIAIILSTFSDYNGIKLEINNKRKTEKLTNRWKLENILLDNH